MLFDRLMRLALKEKYKKEKPPDDPEQAHELLRSLIDEEGILEEGDVMVRNTVQRMFGKLTANSIGGKLGQRKFYSSSMIVHDDIYKRILDLKDCHYDYAVFPLESEAPLEKGFEIRFNLPPERKYQKKKTEYVNEPLASFVTSYSRQKLYKAFQSINELLAGLNIDVSKTSYGIKYCDTDNVVYKVPRGHNIKTGPKLGQLKDEQKKNGQACCSFKRNGEIV